MASLPGAGGTWFLNPPTSFTLDLTALPNGVNLIPNLNTSHRLDFAVGTETAVDFAQLQVTYCGPQGTLSGVPYSLSGGQIIHEPEGQSFVPLDAMRPMSLTFDIGLAEGIWWDLNTVNPGPCSPIGANNGLLTDWPTGLGTTAHIEFAGDLAATMTFISMSQPSNMIGNAVEVLQAGQVVSRRSEFPRTHASPAWDLATVTFLPTSTIRGRLRSCAALT